MNTVNKIEWPKIKRCIQEDLLNRNLAKPSIRLNALNRIENLLNVHFSEIISNPVQLLEISKTDFKIKLEKYKKLSGAESSVINNIYDYILTQIHKHP